MVSLIEAKGRERIVFIEGKEEKKKRREFDQEKNCWTSHCCPWASTGTT